MASGPTDSRVSARPARVFRGSNKRVRRIRMRGNDSRQLWLLILWVAFLLLVVIPWMIRHGH
jgi:hypothetical protein